MSDIKRQFSYVSSLWGGNLGGYILQETKNNISGGQRLTDCEIAKLSQSGFSSQSIQNALQDWVKGSSLPEPILSHLS